MNQSFPRVLYSDFTARTTYASSNTEATLLAGVNSQAVIPSLSFDDAPSPRAKAFLYEAWGWLGTTSAPTLKWIVRLGTTAANDITGTIIGSTATTTMSSVSDGTLWHLSQNIVISAAGQGTTNLTLAGFGGVHSSGIPVGFAGLEITAHPTTTWDAASWNSLLTYYISLSAVYGTSSSANKVKCMSQRLTELN